MISERGWKKHPSDGKIIFNSLGILPYSFTLEKQERISNELMEGYGSETIIVCEQEPVYTCGIHRDDLSLNLNPLYMITRGGGITFHGPGQIVSYFLVDLNRRKMNILDLIEFVHGAEIDYLNIYNVKAESRLGKETGIWVNNKKISSTGFSIRGGFTMHGIGLNIQTEMEKFEAIRPCGFDPSIMTSLQKCTGRTFNMETEKQRFQKILFEKINGN